MKCLVLFALLGCSHGDAWSKYEAPDHLFAVELPGAPKVFTKPTAEIPPTTVQRFLVERGDRGSFQVATYVVAMELTGETAEAGAKLDCLGAITDSGYAIEDQHVITLGTARGVAITAASTKTYEEQRCLIAGKRMFHLVAVGPNDAAMRADAKHFVDSFAIEGSFGYPPPNDANQ